MNTTRFVFFALKPDLINRLKDYNVPIVQDDEYVYVVCVPVCKEAALYDLIIETVKETAATGAVHIFYQDPGTGESSEEWMAFYKGEFVEIGDGCFYP